MSSAINAQGEITVIFKIDENVIYEGSPTMCIFELGGVVGSDGISLIKDSNNNLVIDINAVNNNYASNGTTSHITYPIFLMPLNEGFFYNINVTIKWDENGVYGYFEGNPIDQQLLSLSINPEERLTIGSRYNGTLKFPNNVSILKISDVKKTDEITMNEAMGLVPITIDANATFMYENPHNIGEVKSVGQFTINDFNDVNVSTMAPSTPVVDQLWLDVTIVPNLLKRWSGSEWLIVNDVSTLQEEIDATYGTLAARLTTTEAGLIATNESVALKASKTEVDALGNLITANSSSISVLDTKINMEVSSLNSDIASTNSNVSEIKTYMNFDANGLTLGKTGSPLQISISNQQMNFLDNGNTVAYVNGQKMYINSLEVLSSLVVGVHKLEKYASGNLTLIKYIG